MQVDEWVSRGYNLVSINYRLLDDNPPLTTGPADPFAFLSFLGPPGIVSEVNASFEDASLALEWIHANAATYGFDTARVGVAGHSAGAIMALALGHIVPEGSVEPKVVVSVAGALFNLTSPFSPGGPPTMLITGEKDNTVPAALVEVTRDEMNEVGIMTEYYLQPGVGHQPRWDTVIDGETLSQHGINFLNEYLATTFPELIGDADGDCTIGAADYALWAAQFGQTGAGLSADFDGNGDVGAADYALWAANFGNTCSSSAAVPEPSTFALGALAMMIMLGTAARRRAVR